MAIWERLNEEKREWERERGGEGESNSTETINIGVDYYEMCRNAPIPRNNDTDNIKIHSEKMQANQFINNKPPSFVCFYFFFCFKPAIVI